MSTSRKLATHRLFAILAWFVFVFCTGVIITGFIVGMAGESSAEEVVEEEVSQDGDAQQADGQEVAAAAEPTDEAELTGEVGDGEPASADEVTTDDVSAGTTVARGPPSDAELEMAVQYFSDMTVTEAARSAEGVAAGVADHAQSITDQPTLIVLGDMGDETPVWQRLISFLGIFALLFVAWLMSNNRRKVNWKLVTVGVGLQIGFAVVIFFVPGGEFVFAVATEAVTKLLQFTDDGSNFIFASFVTREWEPGLINFAFAVLPTIIFFSALMTILYHLGIMQKLVHFFALAMQKTMNISGAESTSAAANIFVGQTEAPLVVKPFVKDMTMSELMVVMTGGFATVAGGVLAVYVGMLGATFPDIAGHLIAASVMSAPAALVVAKIMYPETGDPVTMGKLDVQNISEDINVLDAASRGAGEGLRLALNVGAMLLAFIALIALINYLLGFPSLMRNQAVLADLAEYYAANGMAVPDGCLPDVVADERVRECVMTMQASVSGAAADAWVAPMITMEQIFGYVFWPFAFIMGVPVQDCFTIGQLLGQKMVINELVAYASLQQILLDPEVVLSERSIIIATYALCGFANFGSIGIQLGGIGGIAPSRKQDLAKIALKAMIGGTIAAFMTGTIAGILV